ncbi:hypothetical protein MUDAN_DOGOELCO_03336 [Lactiplantibacillus mudanjiangensis]|uniref:hypothetical protein n=1 Tax=Lactiplantibacillus mudanjiangensis TaxID=1296538 RepID=UPI001014CEAD|nr:hypothetical protein [Lactiplantibacillus mudanjiangensis]VDG31490.1 hypothetical protein MUDAN_DOGOELCO_03336 [Lactiplantibacillus mudanjiangensis]
MKIIDKRTKKEVEGYKVGDIVALEKLVYMVCRIDGATFSNGGYALLNLSTGEVFGFERNLYALSRNYDSKTNEKVNVELIIKDKA